MYRQIYDPVASSLGWSALVAAIPLAVLFVLLGGLRIRAHWASLAALAVAIVLAVAVYSMPVDQALLSASQGAAFGLFPIMWIVVNALWIYNMTVDTGHFAALQRSFRSVSSDQRVQALIIAFCFGALLEALAGFGTPVAICSVMLIALGFRPLKAATLALVANTAPVAFGGIAIPIVTLSGLTGLPKDQLGEMVGRQTPFLALVVPLILIALVDGRRGLRQTWPAGVVCGITFAVAQFVTSNYISVELTDIVASLLSMGALVVFLRAWQPAEPLLGRLVSAPPTIAGAAVADPAFERDVARRERRRLLEAYAPYLIIVVVFGLAQWKPIKDFLADRTVTFGWPGLDVADPAGKPLASATYTLNYLAAAGTLLLVSGLLTVVVLHERVTTAARTYVRTIVEIRWAILTVAAVLALAYVMNQSGVTTTMGLWVAGAGGVLFAFLSPIIGWFGVAVTGSDTSSNSLFGSLQVAAANHAGLPPILTAAANSSGGVMGKMVSPQNLAIGLAAVNMAAHDEERFTEGDLFRRVIVCSLAMLLLMALIVMLQATDVLGWMVPG